MLLFLFFKSDQPSSESQNIEILICTFELLYQVKFYNKFKMLCYYQQNSFNFVSESCAWTDHCSITSTGSFFIIGFTFKSSL